ncbi:cholesterol esterase [Allomyces arbusculus]|nr:cholesterol esterase [Allomyces arbusculus]
MAHIPVVSRLRVSEYFDLALALIAILLEQVLRVAIAIFPSRTVDYVRYKAIPSIPRVFRGFMDHDGHDEDEPVDPIADMTHIRDMVEHFGFPLEEHLVYSDGYCLGIHRIPHGPFPPPVGAPESSDDARANGPAKGSVGESSSADDVVVLPPTPISVHGRPVVLLWHGFMMCSEVWVCSRTNSLAFMLAEDGYDVWLGNNRGNKYAFKHLSKNPNDAEFWDFSLDQYTQDLSNVVDYVLAQTGQPSLIYVGFSQGTAQLFAALSSNPALNQKIRLACCLAPTGKPHDLKHSLVASLVKSSPSLLYLLFGRKSAIPSVFFWQRVFARHMFIRVMDASMAFLFSWTNSEMSRAAKLSHYYHLYSPASVKSVVHWFQIIRGSFSMYDDAPGLLAPHALTHVPASYPLRNIKTPIALFYGGRDTLSDLGFLLTQLPTPAFVLKVQEYEHLDCLWASSAHSRLFPAVVGVMRALGARHPDGSRAEVPRDLIADEVVAEALARGTAQLGVLEMATRAEDETVLETVAILRGVRKRVAAPRGGATRGGTRMAANGAGKKLAARGHGRHVAVAMRTDREVSESGSE